MNTDKIENKIKEWAAAAMLKRSKTDCKHKFDLDERNEFVFCERCKERWKKEEEDFIDIKEFIRIIHKYLKEELVEKIMGMKPEKFSADWQGGYYVAMSDMLKSLNSKK